MSFTAKQVSILLILQKFQYESDTITIKSNIFFRNQCVSRLHSIMHDFEGNEMRYVPNMPHSRRFLIIWLTPYQTVPIDIAYDLVDAFFDQMVDMRMNTEDRCSAKGYWCIDSYDNTCHFRQSGFRPPATQISVDPIKAESAWHMMTRLCNHTDGDILTILFDHVTVAQIRIVLPKRTAPVDHCVNCLNRLDESSEIRCDSCGIAGWCGDRCFRAHNSSMHVEWCTCHYFRQTRKPSCR